MIDNAIIPSCAFIEGQFFRRDDLARKTPRWWWWPARRAAWRSFRTRMVAANREIEEGRINSSVCWAELRMFVVDGERSALMAAVEMTRHADLVKGLVGGLGLRFQVDALTRNSETAYSP